MKLENMPTASAERTNAVQAWQPRGENVCSEYHYDKILNAATFWMWAHKDGNNTKSNVQLSFVIVLLHGSKQLALLFCYDGLF